MTRFNNGIVKGAFLAPLLLAVIMITMALPLQPAQAAGQIAMSGTFYSQDFEVPQGVEVANQSIYVVVFNHSDSEFTVHLTPNAPKEVQLSFSKQDFSLQPGAQEKVYVGVRVAEDAVPGEYRLMVTAEGRRGDIGKGIQMVTAVAQEARLKVTGEAAWLNARVVSPDGDLVVATVRLFKEIQSRLNEFASSETGTLEAKLSLGRYIVCAYVGGEKLAEEAIDMTTANEKKKVTLTVKTAYFANFGIVPNYYKNDGKLAFAKVVYQVRNLYQPMAQVDLILKVSHNSETVEEVPVLSLSQLTLGDTAGSRDYIPSQGWQSGTYTFQAELHVGSKFYASTLEEKLEVTVTSSPRINLAFLIGIIGATLVAIVGLVSLILNRRRRVFRSSGQR